MAECGCACADCQCGTERIESLRAALCEAETQRDDWRLAYENERDVRRHQQERVRVERGRAEAAEQEIEEHRQHAQDKHRRAEALEAALRRFDREGPTIIGDETTHHFAGCDGYACREPNPVLDAHRCLQARRALAPEAQIDADEPREAKGHICGGPPYGYASWCRACEPNTQQSEPGVVAESALAGEPQCVTCKGTREVRCDGCVYPSMRPDPDCDGKMPCPDCVVAEPEREGAESQ